MDKMAEAPKPFGFCFEILSFENISLNSLTALFVFVLFLFFSFNLFFSNWVFFFFHFLQIVRDCTDRVFTWGFGGYGRLGHQQPKDEHIPRLVAFFKGKSECSFYFPLVLLPLSSQVLQRRAIRPTDSRYNCSVRPDVTAILFDKSPDETWKHRQQGYTRISRKQWLKWK